MRCALVLSASPTSQLKATLPLHADWRLAEVRTIEAASALLASNNEIRVGLWIYVNDVADAQTQTNFSALRARHAHVQWLAVVVPAAIEEHAIAAHIAQHFVDYLTIPVDRERLYAAAGHAEGMSRLLERTAGGIASIAADSEMVGSSAAMCDLFRLIRKVAASEAPVFISGESGTGKELAARAIHERSSRKKGPFIAVDCGAIAPTLVQSELFGHEKGAFTGATQSKPGRIEAAEGGTLFLDEIGDLPLDLQGNLLRFLQQSTIQRVGSTKPISIDARVIAATHVNLDEAAAQGRFREDLFYRFNVLRIHVPALRERGSDIDVLARFFLAHFSKDSGKLMRGYTTDALARLRRHPWPGNVRELINRVRRAIVMSDGPWITPDDLDLPAAYRSAENDMLQLDSVRELAEREAVCRAIALSSNNYSAAARMLGVSRPTFYRLLEKHRPSLISSSMQT
jgi:DNA-binding NtrC family response regulator